MLTGCKTFKRSTSTTKIADSTSRKEALVVRDTVERFRDRIIRDTIIKVDSKTVHDTITLADLETPKTKEGKILPRHHEKVEDGVKSFVTVLPDGQIIYGCEVDELLLQVRNLERTVQHERQVSDSLKTVIELKSHTEERTFKEFVKKVKANTGWIIVIVVVVIVFFVLRYLVNRYNIFSKL